MFPVLRIRLIDQGDNADHNSKWKCASVGTTPPERIAINGSDLFICADAANCLVACLRAAIAGRVGTATERTSVMLRLRNAVMAVAMGMGVMGCSSPSNIGHYSIWHCSECDDFPTPAYGPGYSMMPGTYTGPTARDSAGSNQPSTASPNQPSTATPNSGSAPPPQQQPDGAAPAPSTTITPPTPPAASPTDALPSSPATDRNNLPNPANNP